MAHVIIEVLSEWGVKNCIKALSFDTTSSNTGRKNGVCMLVEMQLWKKVLYLAGRHHIHEILLEEAFSITMGPSTGPDILYFSEDIKHFGRTFLSLTSNLEWKSSQLLLLSWIFS